MDQESAVPSPTGVPDEPPLPAEWPKVVGITSIVWSALSLGCGGCGVVGLLTPMFMPMDQAFPDGVPPVLTDPPMMMWVSFLFGTLVSMWLMACGIVLVMRKPAARPMHLVYAVLGILSAAVGTWLSLTYRAEMDAWVAQNPNTKFAQSQQGGSAVFGLVMTVLGILLGFAWPVFCLVWFGAVKRDSSEISRGAGVVI